jgi:hypothetical protein
MRRAEARRCTNQCDVQIANETTVSWKFDDAVCHPIAVEP